MWDDRENVQTRRSDNIYIPRCDSNFAMKLPLFNYPEIWNQWINNNQNTFSRHVTKRKLKSSYLIQYATMVKCNNPLRRDCKNSTKSMKSYYIINLLLLLIIIYILPIMPCSLVTKYI